MVQMALRAVLLQVPKAFLYCFQVFYQVEKQKLLLQATYHLWPPQ